MDTDPDIAPEDSLAFEKYRLRYCMDVFNREEERKEQLERKSQFYLSFITLFLGALFLKTDSLVVTKELTHNSNIPPALITALYLTIIALGGLILFTVIAILQVSRLWGYKSPFPKDIVETYFSPDEDMVRERDQARLLRKTALNYAVALDFNSSINDRKSRWIMISSYMLFLSVAAFAVLLGIIVYVLVYY